MKRMFGVLVGSAARVFNIGRIQHCSRRGRSQEYVASAGAQRRRCLLGQLATSEQWQRLVNGPVAKKLVKLPVVEKAWKEFLKQWNDRSEQLSQARTVWENPNFKEALEFFMELGSEETFFFADKNLSSFIKATNEFTTEMQTALVEAQNDPEEAMPELFDKWIGELEKLKLPTMVLGAKFQDEDLANTKVDQLEALIQLPLMASGQTQLQGIVKRVDDSRGSRLSITVNGKLIPWDSIPTTDEFDEETIENLRDVLDDKNITLTVGMLDKYFVVAFSETTKDLLALGKGDSLLSHPDFCSVVAMCVNL